MTRQPRPVRRLLPLLDPLLGGAPLVKEAHDRAIGEQEIRDDEAHAREQLADVVLDLRHNPSGRRPGVRLILNTLVADERLEARPSR